MVTLFGEGNGEPHIVYRNEDTLAVMKILEDVKDGNAAVKLFTDPSFAKEYERLFLHSEADIIKLLDGITIMTKEGPRRMYIMLAEDQK